MQQTLIIQHNNANKWLAAALACGALGVMTVPSHAQNNPAPNAGNGANQAQQPDFRNLTQEQRQQLMQQVSDYTRELTMRLMLGNAGFTDKAVQDAVIAFANDQAKVTQTLGQQQRQLMQAMQGQAVPAKQLSILLNDFNGAIEDELTRRTGALKELDAKINYSKQPRLDAVLTVLGVVGNEMALADGNGGNGGMMGGFGGRGGFGGPGGPGGFGGPGGGFGGGPGGGFGGRGGFGGPGGGGPGGFGGPGDGGPDGPPAGAPPGGGNPADDGRQA